MLGDNVPCKWLEACAGGGGGWPVWDEVHSWSGISTGIFFSDSLFSRAVSERLSFKSCVRVVVMIERGSNWHLRDRLDRQRARSRHWSWWWMRNGRGGGSIVVNTCREFLWFSIQSCSEWVTVLHFCGGLLCVVVMVGAGKELKRTASFESAILSQNGRR